MPTLETLPGVGPYTARAVAALAFGVPVGAVDTNVRRVLGRIVSGDAAAFTSREMQALADAVVPPEHPGLWTHALMDIGATLCRAASTDCGRCPAAPWCGFASSGAVARRPLRGTRERAVPFERTNRWLRGRILDLLRDSTGDAWLVVAAPIGGHDQAAVDGALIAMASDGLIELDARGGARLRVS